MSRCSRALIAAGVLAASFPDPEAWARPVARARPAIVRIEGRVVTMSGSPVAGARVRLADAAPHEAVVTDAKGGFRLEVPAGAPGPLVVDAPGFEPAAHTLAPGPEGLRPVIVVAPALREEVVVVATRIPTRAAEIGSSVRVVSADDLDATGAVRLDDALRQVPGFSLLRRSGSRTANPTSQGVSLRGIGASGASRTLVLDDGVPLNDPFGGWVHWGRVPRAALHGVEVLRGGASDVYGSAALSGVIGVLRTKPEAGATRGELTAGSEGTAGVSLFSGGRRERWGGSVAGDFFESDGYVPVEPAARGAVDAPAGVRHGVVDLTGERFGEAHAFFARASFFDESRANGTRLQTNATDFAQAAFGWDRRADAASLALRAYATRQDYAQAFSAVSADRDSESLTRRQEVPSRAAGLSAQWSAPWRARHTLVAGVDFRGVRGRSDETIFEAAGPVPASAGGTQWSGGAYVEEIVGLGSRLTLAAGARFDRWRNGDASATSGGITTRLRDRGEDAVSPRLAILVRPGEAFSVSASVYRSFRAPTLNELYRPFRLGNVVTLANDDLRAERLRGAEAGLRFAPPSGRLDLRGDLFWMEVDDPVANVTLSESPDLITRQRRNLGGLRSRGVEIEASLRFAAWTLTAGALVTESLVTSFPADPGLEGRRVPQVPRGQGTVQLRHARPSAGTAALQVRWSGMQFDDDRNRLPLGRALIVDALYERPLGDGRLALFLAGENLLDEPYEIGRTPVTLLGAPRTVRGGIRFSTSRAIQATPAPMSTTPAPRVKPDTPATESAPSRPNR